MHTRNLRFRVSFSVTSAGGEAAKVAETMEGSGEDCGTPSIATHLIVCSEATMG